MIDLRKLDRWRYTGDDIALVYGTEDYHLWGFFFIPSPIDKQHLKVMAANAEGWDHVSVSRPNRPPNWTEMDFIKRMFFKPDETAMQLHVPVSDHINIHPNVLHLWRPHDVEIPRPPAEFV